MCDPLHHRDKHQHEREESNPVQQLWRLPALPGAHSCKYHSLQLVRRAGVEPAKPEGGWVTATEACQCPTDACYRVAQVGVEPTASLVLSQGGLPVAYRAVAFRSSPIVPDGVEPSFPVGIGVVAAGPRDHGAAEPWDSNPQATQVATCFQDRLLIRPDDFQGLCKAKAKWARWELNPRPESYKDSALTAELRASAEHEGALVDL